MAGSCPVAQQQQMSSGAITLFSQPDELHSTEASLHAYSTTLLLPYAQIMSYRESYLRLFYPRSFSKITYRTAGCSSTHYITWLTRGSSCVHLRRVSHYTNLNIFIDNLSHRHPKEYLCGHAFTLHGSIVQQMYLSTLFAYHLILKTFVILVLKVL